MSIRNFRSIKFFAVVSLFAFFNSFVFSQTKTNPFEIKERIPIVKNAAVARSNDGLGQIDTIKSSQTLTPIKQDTIKDSTTILQVAGSNPFEVDHVPIKKLENTLNRKEEIKKLDLTTQKNPLFLFFFSVLSSLLLAIVINFSGDLLKMISKSLTNENALKLFYREDSRSPSGHIYLLYAIFFINIAILIYLILIRFGNQGGIMTFFAILIGVAILYFIRHTSLYILGEIFPLDKQTSLYSFTIKVFNIFIGLILIPLNLIIAFGPESFKEYALIGTVVIVAIVFVLRILRGLIIVYEFLFGRLFQFILYLCAFEIIPVLILIKLILNYNFL